MGPVLDPQLFEERSYWLRKSFAIFDELIGCGNQIAKFRKSELCQLYRMFTEPAAGGPIQSSQPDHNTSHVSHYTNALCEATAEFSRGGPSDGISAVAGPSLPTPFSSGTMPDEDGSGMGNMMTTAQMLDISNSIDGIDTEWMSQAIMDHSIW